MPVTGKEKWRFKTEDWVQLSSPAVLNDIVYVVSMDKNLYAIVGRLIKKFYTHTLYRSTISCVKCKVQKSHQKSFFASMKHTQAFWISQQTRI